MVATTTSLYYMSRSQKVDLVFSYFLILIFIFFRNQGLGLEVIGHTVTSVTSDGVVTTLITRLKRRFWNKVMSHNMDTIYWPYTLHMVI